MRNDNDNKQQHHHLLNSADNASGAKGGRERQMGMDDTCMDEYLWLVDDIEWMINKRMNVLCGWEEN